eukprot:750761-Hanusia_phi.AAC.1
MTREQRDCERRGAEKAHGGEAAGVRRSLASGPPAPSVCSVADGLSQSEIQAKHRAFYNELRPKHLADPLPLEDMEARGMAVSGESEEAKKLKDEKNTFVDRWRRGAECGFLDSMFADPSSSWQRRRRRIASLPSSATRRSASSSSDRTCEETRRSAKPVGLNLGGQADKLLDSRNSFKCLHPSPTVSHRVRA